MLFFPVIVNGLILTCYTLFIKEDSIMFNLSKGDQDGSLRLIRKIYDVSAGSGQNENAILDQLKKQVKKKDVKSSGGGESYCQSLFGAHYWKSTLILGFYALILQWIGANVINIFSNRLITDMNANVPDDKKVLANRAT